MLWLWEHKSLHLDSAPILRRNLTDDGGAAAWYARGRSSPGLLSGKEDAGLIHGNEKAVLDAGFGISILAERSSLTLPVVGR